MGICIPPRPPLYSEGRSRRRKRVGGLKVSTAQDYLTQANKRLDSLSTEAYVPKTNTRIQDTDWDEFFGDLIVKEELTLKETLLKRFDNVSSEYNGMGLTPSTFGTMIANAIVDYEEFLKNETKKKELETNWCEIRN